jgi:integrase/recombinase XerD
MVPQQPAEKEHGGRLAPQKRAWYLAWQASLTALGGRSSPDTIEEAVALLMQDMERRGQQVFTSCRDCYYALRGFVRWCADNGDVRRQQIDRDVLMDYLRHLVAEQFSVYYLKQIRSCLKQLLRFLHLRGWLADDFSATVRLTTRLPRVHPQRILTPTELAALLESPKRWSDGYRGCWKRRHHWLATRDQAILALLIGTGIRCCEASALRIDDIDRDRGIAAIRSKGNQLYIKPQRVAFLDTPRLLKALEAHLLVRPTTQSARMFTTSSGEPIEPSTFWSIVTRYARRADLGTDATPHTLRHTFCSHLVAAGVDPYTVQTLMGHRKAAYTLRWYTHLTEEEIHEDWRSHHPFRPQELP